MNVPEGPTTVTVMPSVSTPLEVLSAAVRRDIREMAGSAQVRVDKILCTLTPHINVLLFCSEIDIDECTRGTDECSEFASCENTGGSYDCSCLLGYQGNGRICLGMCGRVHTHLVLRWLLYSRASNNVEKKLLSSTL